jgi:hypothetical protein
MQQLKYPIGPVTNENVAASCLRSAAKPLTRPRSAARVATLWFYRNLEACNLVTTGKAGTVTSLQAGTTVDCRVVVVRRRTRYVRSEMKEGEERTCPQALSTSRRLRRLCRHAAKTQNVAQLGLMVFHSYQKLSIACCCRPHQTFFIVQVIESHATHSWHMFYLSKNKLYWNQKTKRKLH